MATGRLLDAFARALGFEVLEVRAGRSAVRAAVGPDHLNEHGMAHGGFVFSLADAALALASNSHGPVAVALAASIHFTRPARAGDVLVAEAREVSIGRSTATYEIVVTTANRPVAVFTGTVHRRAD